ncbi:hypothetical protein J7M28_11990, partial [bacterium]|nr:hypothetical protein [bacterium]
QAPDTIKRLVETFGENIDSYRSGSYNEARVRVEFIDPMFEALGWDVSNEAGYADAFKDDFQRSQCLAPHGLDEVKRQFQLRCIMLYLREV